MHTRRSFESTVWMLLFTLAVSGCAIRAAARTDDGSLAHAQPPPPPDEKPAPPARPGYVWVDGHWSWDDGRDEWAWYDGYWVRERQDYRLVPGRWERRGGGYAWVEPHWVSEADPARQIRVDDHSRATPIRVREQSGGRVPPRPVVR
jgi:hypothetical protein